MGMVGVWGADESATVRCGKWCSFHGPLFSSSIEAADGSTDPLCAVGQAARADQPRRGASTGGRSEQEVSLSVRLLSDLRFSPGELSWLTAGWQRVAA